MTSAIALHKTVLDLEEAMRDYPPMEIEPSHYFAPGVYGRMIVMPADSLVVGKLHKTEHLCIILQGHVSVVSQGERQDFHGPCVFNSPIGSKKAVYAHTETHFMAIHPTEETDLEKIEHEVIDNETLRIDKWFG